VSGSGPGARPTLPRRGAPALARQLIEISQQRSSCGGPRTR
jgi:hypothetical protein